MTGIEQRVSKEMQCYLLLHDFDEAIRKVNNELTERVNQCVDMFEFNQLRDRCDKFVTTEIFEKVTSEIKMIDKYTKDALVTSNQLA